jgi:hypothetical protein
MTQKIGSGEIRWQIVKFILDEFTPFGEKSNEI